MQRLRRLTLTAAGLLLASAAGCASDANSDPPAASDSNADEAGQFQLSSDCPDSQLPYLVPMRPETAAESSLQSTLTVCTNSASIDSATSTWIANSGDLAVWVVTSPPGVPQSDNPPSSLRVALFRAALAKMLHGAAPRTIEPSEATTLSGVPPARLQLSLRPDIEAAWAEIKLLGDVVEQSRESVDDYLKKSNSRRSAFYFCALQGFEAGTEFAQAEGTRESLFAALGINQAATECDQALRRVRAEDVRYRRAAAPVFDLQQLAAGAKANEWAPKTELMLTAIREDLVLLHR